jgi:hypothetical protein
MDSLRISDADREAAVALLGEQYAQGRLTKEEFDDRCDTVWSAKTRGEVAPVFVDLPVGSPARFDARRPHPSARPPGPPPPQRRRSMPPLIKALLLVLVVVTVLTHLPLVLFGLLAWFVLSRHCGVARPPWKGHAGAPHRMSR